MLATVRAPNLFSVAALPGLSAVIGPAIFLLLEPRDERALRDIIVEPARLGELESRLAALWDAPAASPPS